MKYINDFRNPKSTQKILKEIEALTTKSISIMEVCGTHTMSIYKNGIKELLPRNIRLISGPGCPVCVTPQNYIDTAIDLSKEKNVIITTFGDMMNVPGSLSSLKTQRAMGSDVRVVYSPLDSLKIARENLDKEVVFLGVGFETTAPIIALSILKAKDENISNFSVLQCIKTMPNIMRKLVEDKEVNIDGFLCPGHVGTVIGARAFEFLSSEFNIPCIVAGFEYDDIICAIYMIISMITKETSKIKNIYGRFVKYDGNEMAQDTISKIFISAGSIWRGLGYIKDTGVEFKEEYKSYDAKEKFKLNMVNLDMPSGCICGEVLKGIKEPTDCKLFSKVCNPSNPVGACMVSQEGTCGIYYRYGR
ncbi:hydrogenase formation protein HypD [Clostridium sp. HMP27]|uniref:hydrogenase formation protein HypD n=1 Tax=Clostridium sp. HMP27 TaxID=1487921 RepID=UPI00052D38F4|nr:hydrogenase formation protein HypD [Clostridium sp. HMP27]KGK90825.1 hydrogenase assembly protein HupF [Clostridium sp. HMP27]